MRLEHKIKTDIKKICLLTYLILSLFFNAAGAPGTGVGRRWLESLNAQYPSFSFMWIDAAQAVYIQVSLDAFRPGFSWSPLSSGARDVHTHDLVGV